ncbi:MAG: 50S ribosomal protein L30, partial [Alphaproteobacteria bacterium]
MAKKAETKKRTVTVEQIGSPIRRPDRQEKT